MSEKGKKVEIKEEVVATSEEQAKVEIKLS